MSQSTSPPAGTRDFLPEDVRRREHVVARIRAAYERHGFAPLETPAIERVETLTGKYGDEGEQLIFRILKRGDKLAQETEVDPKRLADLALRYDLTVPLARVCAAHQARLPKFFKRYQIQPVWRADRPQKGRFREFYQCDVDYVGTRSLVAELEVLQAVGDALAALSFERFHLRLNDRRILSGLMAAAGVPPEKHGEVIVGIDKLDKIGVEGVRGELEQRGLAAGQIEVLAPVLFACETDVAGNNQRLAVVERALAGAGAAGLAGVQGLRELLGLLVGVESLASRVLFDPSLARGLSYYTGPIFELAVEGLAGSMGGGGRYDGLVGMFAGRELPAVGFSLGLERILVVMEERGMLPATSPESEAMVLQADAAYLTRSVALATALAQAGVRVELYPESARLGNQFQYAAARGVVCAVFVGEREASAGTVAVKHLPTGIQKEVPAAELVASVRAFLAG